MKKISLLLILVLLFGCKKEKPPVLTPTSKPNPKWEKINFNQGYNYGIRAAKIKDRYIYLIADYGVLKIDSTHNIISNKPTNAPPLAGLQYKPTLSNKYVAQVNYNKTSMLVYELENPKIVSFISFDYLSPNYSPYLDKFGKFNDRDELLLGTSYSIRGKKKVTANKLSFSTTGSNINYQNTYYALDTAESTISSVFSINANKGQHYATAGQGTYRFDNSAYSHVAIFHIINLININDTLYASIAWNNVHGDGLFVSYDNGLSWTQIVSGIGLSNFQMYNIDGKIIFSGQKEIFQLIKNKDNNSWQLRELDNSGILEELGNYDEITDMFFLGNKVYIATSNGVYFKNLSDLEIEKEK